MKDHISKKMTITLKISKVYKSEQLFEVARQAFEELYVDADHSVRISALRAIKDYADSQISHEQRRQMNQGVK